MSDEMILRYLYFLTHMNSGTLHWKPCFEAWNGFGVRLGHDDYPDLIDKVRKFDKKYQIIKKRS